MTGYATPEAVLEAYAEGTRRLDRALLAGCFHPSAVMAGDLDGRILAGSPAPFLDDIAGMAAAGVDHSMIRIVVADVIVTDAIAIGTVRTDGFGGRYRFKDRFHLLREDGMWRITAKLFTTL